MEPWPSRRRCSPLPWGRAASSRVLPHHCHLPPTGPTPCLPACPQSPTCSAASRAQVDLNVRYENAQTGYRKRHCTESDGKCTSLSLARVLARTRCVVHPSPAILHLSFTSRSSLHTSTHTLLHKHLPPPRMQKAGEGQTCHFQSNMSRAAAAGAVSPSPAADGYM